MRITVEFSEENKKRIEQMMAETDIRTKKDLINNALTLLEWSIRETRAGRLIASFDQKTRKYRELVMPALACRQPEYSNKTGDNSPEQRSAADLRANGAGVGPAAGSGEGDLSD